MEEASDSLEPPRVGPEMRRALKALGQEKDGTIAPPRAEHQRAYAWLRKHMLQASVFRRLQNHGLVRVIVHKEVGYYESFAGVTLTEKGRALLVVWELREPKTYVFETVTGRISSGRPNIQQHPRSK